MQHAHSTTDVHSACELMMTIAHCDDDTMLSLTRFSQQMRKLTFSSCCAFLRVMHERLRHFICILNSSNDFFYLWHFPSRFSYFPPAHLLSLSGNNFFFFTFPVFLHGILTNKFSVFPIVHLLWLSERAWRGRNACLDLIVALSYRKIVSSVSVLVLHFTIERAWLFPMMMSMDDYF